MTPDPAAASRDEDAVWRTVEAALGAAGPVPRHPAVMRAGQRAQRLEREGRPKDALDAASLRRLIPAPRTAGPQWPVDLPSDQPHLAEAVARALAAVPPRGDGPDGAHDGAAARRSWVHAWRPEQEAVFAEAVARLASLWPQMMAELRTGVTQIALLEGGAIDGFTDFAVHGAIFVHARRLGDRRDGLPGWIRMADALVHEGTHTRCNAASLSTPFVAGSAAAAQSVMTPLRADPRPFTGLFQQMVVLVRQVMLYRRLLEGHKGSGAVASPARCAPPDGVPSACGASPDDPPSAYEAVRARLVHLVGAAHQATGTLRRHRAALTGHGYDVLVAAEAYLRGEEERVGRLSAASVPDRGPGPSADRADEGRI